MNRTQRAIKRQHRESEAASRRRKNNSIEQMNYSSGGGLFNHKGRYSKEVRDLIRQEKGKRIITREYKDRVLSEKDRRMSET